MAKGNGGTISNSVGGIYAIDKKFSQSSLEKFGGDSSRYIANMKGFDGKPKIVSQAELEAMRDRGEVEMIQRVMTGENIRANIDALKNGDYFLGGGNYGRGIYFADNEEYGNRLFKGNATSQRVMAGLSKSAKVGIYEDLQESYRQEHWARGNSSLKNSFELTENFGAWAMAKGYDAIRVRDSLGIVIVYNRKKLIFTK